MTIDLKNYNPMYVVDPTDRSPKYVVTAEEWSILWKLISLQTNNISETVYEMLKALNGGLWSDNGAAYLKSYPIPGCVADNVKGQLLWLKDLLDSHKIASDHDLRYYTKSELAKYLQGGDTSIGTEVFTIKTSNNGDGTFTYNDGTQDITGTITAEGYQVFTLTKGEYLMSSNRIEAIINDTLHRSVASGGLVELDSKRVALAVPEGAGAEITFKYYIRISLVGEHSISYGTEQPPVTLSNQYMWFKVLEA
jgi:hypothetical protein